MADNNPTDNPTEQVGNPLQFQDPTDNPMPQQQFIANAWFAQMQQAIQAALDAQNNAQIQADLEQQQQDELNDQLQQEIDAAAAEEEEAGGGGAGSGGTGDMGGRVEMRWLDNYIGDHHDYGWSFRERLGGRYKF